MHAGQYDKTGLEMRMKKKTAIFLLISLLFLLLPFQIFENVPAADSAAVNGNTSSQIRYVTDSAGILSDEESAELEEKAKSVSEEYGVGVYAVTVSNYEDYDTDGVYEAAYGIYHQNHMGLGDDRNGILLLLSMNNRKWAMFCYGAQSEYAFNSYGQEQLEDEFLDDFHNDDWYDGFQDYIDACDEYLGKAAEGHPVRKNPTVYLLMVLAAALIVAGVVVGGMAAAMKNIGLKREAEDYVSGNLKLTKKNDRFLRTDVIRRKIEKNPPPDAGSHSESGGGGSGRSGSF